jgi:hypothetical protein
MTGAEILHEEAVERIKRDRREQRFRVGLSFLTAAVVIAGVSIFGFRQVQYHNDTAKTDSRVTCEISTLNKILLELQESQAAIYLS